MPPSTLEKFLSVPDIAESLGVTPEKIHGWIASGELTAINTTQNRIVVPPCLPSAEGEQLTEQYVDSVLPSCYRRLYFPGNLRAMEMRRKIRPSELERTDFELALIKKLNKLSGCKEVVSCLV